MTFPALSSFHWELVAGFAIDFVSEHAVDVNFALSGLNCKFFLKPTAAATNDGAAFVS